MTDTQKLVVAGFAVIGAKHTVDIVRANILIAKVKFDHKKRK